MDKKTMETMLHDALHQYGTGIGLNTDKISIKEVQNNAYYCELDKEIALLKIRDCLELTGKIYIEDKDAGKYTAELNGDPRKLTKAMAIIVKENNKIKVLAYAKEGLIKQHIAEKSVAAFIKRINK